MRQARALPVQPDLGGDLPGKRIGRNPRSGIAERRRLGFEQPASLDGDIRASGEMRPRRCPKCCEVHGSGRGTPGIEQHLPWLAGTALPHRKEHAVPGRRLRSARQRERSRRVTHVETACDTGLRRLPDELQRQRIGRRGARAPRFAQPHRRRLERDAVVGEVGEECVAYAALDAHPRECKLRVDERAECNFLGIGLVRECGVHAGVGERDAQQHGCKRSQGWWISHDDRVTKASARRAFSIIGRLRSLSMRPFTLTCALFCAFAALSVSATAQSPVIVAARKAAPAAAPAPAPTANPPVVVQAQGAPGAPSIAAASWVLIDTLSGQTLGSANPDERRDPASLTKLMTAYVAFGAIRAKTITPSQMVQVSQRAWKAEGSRMFIEPRKAVSVDELLHGVIIQSGNDASVAVAELVAGTRGSVRRTDERGGGAAEARVDALHQCDGIVQSAALLDRGRHGEARRRADPRLSRLLPDLFAEGIPLQQHHAIEPQPVAVDGPVRRRRQDGAHRRGGLVPDRIRQARRPPARVGGARRRVGFIARRREPEAAELGLPGIRHDCALSVRQAGDHAARLERRRRRMSRRGLSPTAT